jgi:hypothetical protein
MSNLTTKIKLYCEANNKTANFTENVLVWDNSDGNGQYIKLWNVSGLAQPTTDQLATYESTGNDEEAKQLIIFKRKAEYPSIAELVVALYDTEDKLALENKRAAVKLKYPKESS